MKKRLIKKSKPDEWIDNGLIRIERHGRFVVMKNNMDSDTYLKYTQSRAKVAQDALADLINFIAELQSTISQYDPIELMHRAVPKFIIPAIQKQSETDYSKEEAFALPGIEYLQYIISRTEFKNNLVPKPEEWEDIWLLIIKIIETTDKYIFNKNPKTIPPTELDSIRMFLDIKRLFIRVERYAIFIRQYWKDTLDKYSYFTQKYLGIDSTLLFKGLLEIHSNSRVSLSEAYKEAMESQILLFEELTAKGINIDQLNSKEGVNQQLEHIDEFNLQDIYADYQKKMKKAFTVELFELDNPNIIPNEILDLLSIVPSESPLYDYQNDRYEDLSPLSDSKLHHKPFVKIGDKYYYFHHSGLEDKTIELIEQCILNRIESATDKVKFHKQRADLLEDTIMQLLADIFEKSKCSVFHTNLLYPNPDIENSLAEVDGLILIDDILIIVECKSGIISDASLRGAPQRLVSDLSELIVNASHQAERTERYLHSAAMAKFYDKSGKKEICSIERSKIRKVFRILATREPLGWIGAKIARLSIIDEDIHKSPPWHVSIDDLRVCADLFKSKSVTFVHFLEQRLAASQLENMEQFDEIDHIGLYFKRNSYSTPELVGNFTHRTYTHYSKDIDLYFSDKYRDLDPDVPQQDIPNNLEFLISCIQNSSFPYRFEAASFLLDLSHDSRVDIDNKLAYLFEKRKENRFLSLRFPLIDSRKGITISFAQPENWDEELAKSAALMEESDSLSWLLLKLELSNSNDISLINISKIDPNSVPDFKVKMAKELIINKIKELSESRKIGRNETCPCGSGKKFKKCHAK